MAVLVIVTTPIVVDSEGVEIISIPSGMPLVVASLLALAGAVVPPIMVDLRVEVATVLSSVVSVLSTVGITNISEVLAGSVVLTSELVVVIVVDTVADSVVVGVEGTVLLAVGS